MSRNPAQQLIELGQSVWYDNISRDIIDSGELQRLVEEWGVRGITSNPTIFDKAISSSGLYDQTISRLKLEHPTPDRIFEELAVDDIGRAADVLRPIYDESGGNDGFVSIEVSPLLAADTKGTIDEGRRLFRRLGRPNIMIKVPGTPEGLPAFRELIADGINVNVTLLFSVQNYIEVARTYIEALKRRLELGNPIDRVRSVASFFVSRVDTAIDKRLDSIVHDADTKRAVMARELRGKFGVANSRIAYLRFQEIFGGAAFSALRDKGAAAQRPLWASTGTKDPAYSDVVYIDELIGRDTVNTIPHATLKAFVNHGKPAETISKDLPAALSIESALYELGVDVGGLLDDLQVEGVQAFASSFRSLNAAIEKKLTA